MKIEQEKYFLRNSDLHLIKFAIYNFRHFLLIPKIYSRGCTRSFSDPAGLEHCVTYNNLYTVPGPNRYAIHEKLVQ